MELMLLRPLWLLALLPWLWQGWRRRRQRPLLAPAMQAYLLPTRGRAIPWLWLATLPVILALGKANSEEAEFWRRTMVGHQQSDADLTHAIHLIDRHQAIAGTLARARQFTEEACRALNVFPESPMRRALADLAEFCVSRAY